MSRKKSSPKTDLRLEIPSHLSEPFIRELEGLLHQQVKLEGDRQLTKTSYQLEQMLSKYMDDKKVSPGDRRQAAIDKWLATENRNKDTNHRLYIGLDPVYDGLDYEAFMPVVRRARHIIADILGPFSYTAITCLCGQTNGASTRVRRGPKAAAQKFVGASHATERAAEHFLHMNRFTIHERENLLFDAYGPVENSRVFGCRLSSVMFTVPKKTEIDRVACKEPEVNLYLQKGVGNYIRKRLRKVGINLNDQTINKDLSRRALKLGLATVDLSAASDSVTDSLVRLLLPWEYYSYLDDLRVKECILPDGQIHQLEMFSSMGNGFTFELESLLFYAIARATAWRLGVKGRISVYGDDLIVPQELEWGLTASLTYFGFTLNQDKSFWSGPFRESCGGHYLNGVDITPFYIRGPLRTLPDLIRALNQLYEWDSRGWGFFITEEYASFHRKWSQYVPAALRGGYDTSRDDSLVSGDSPRKRIIPKLRSVGAPPSGRLIAWLDSRKHVSRYDPILLPELDESPDLTLVPKYGEQVGFNVVTGYRLVDNPRDDRYHVPSPYMLWQ